MVKKIKMANVIKRIIADRKADRKKNFRLSSKKLFLTYSPCTLSCIEALDQLKIILKNKIESYIITREKSENLDDFHLHCFLKLNNRCDITGPNSLDLKSTGIENSSPEKLNFHGIYQTAKCEETTLDYILKKLDLKKAGSNMIYSEDYKKLLTDKRVLFNLDEAMLRLAEEGRVNEAMTLLEKKILLGLLENTSDLKKV